MKKTNWVMGIVLGMMVTATASASNYPPDYCNPTASISTDGPAIVARLGAGCTGPRYVIGYKGWGMFGSRPFVDAIVTVHCRSYNGYTMSSTPMMVRLEREWHGAGFMTEALHEGSGIFSVCGQGYPSALSIAFSSNGQWDSRYGSNYQIDFGRVEASYKSKSPMTHQVPLDTWDFIVDQMRR